MLEILLVLSTILIGTIFVCLTVMFIAFTVMLIYKKFNEM